MLLSPLVVVDAGSRYEVRYTSGISHFLQRLAFQVIRKWVWFICYTNDVMSITQSSALFSDREALMSEMEKYGGIFDCQRFRDIMMYSLSVFSSSVPEAVRVLADTLWRPHLKEEEVKKEECGTLALMQE